MVLTEKVVSSSSSPSPSASWMVAAGRSLAGSSPSSPGVASASGVSAAGVDASEGVWIGVAPKRGVGILLDDDAASPSLSSIAFAGGVPKPNPSGLPILPLGFPKTANGLDAFEAAPEPNAPLLPNGLGGTDMPKGLELPKLELVAGLGFSLSFDSGDLEEPYPKTFGTVDDEVAPKSEVLDEVCVVPPKSVLGELADEDPNV